MNCKNCGNPLVPEDKFCKLCGTPVQKNNNLGGMPNNQGNRPNGPAPMPNNRMQQPMKQQAPGKVNPGMGGPAKPGNNGPVGPGPVPKPMNNNQPHGMNLEKTQVLGNTQNMRPVGGPNNRPQGMAPNGRPMPGQGPQRPVPPAPVPGMPMNNAPVPPTPTPVPVQEPESKGGAMKVILIVLLILGLAVGGYFGYKALANKDDGEDTSDSGAKVVNTTKKVDFSGYTFEVPTRFMVQIDEELGEEALTLDDGKFGFIMMIMDHSYSQLLPAQIVTNFNSRGYSAEYNGEKTAGDYKYHLFTVKQAGDSLYVAYTSLGASKLAVLTIYNNPTSVLPTQASIDETIKIIGSGKYTGAHSIEADDIRKIDPRSFIFEEVASTGDVSNYTEEYSYADVTVNELY